MNEDKIKQQNFNAADYQKGNIATSNVNGQQIAERKGLHQTVKQKNLKVQTNFIRSQTIRDVSAGAVLQGRNQFEFSASAYLNPRDNAPVSATTTPRVLAKSNQKMEELSKKFQFNLKEIEVLKQRFDAISKKGILTLQDFKDSLGVMGRDNTLVDRIFALMDENSQGQAYFEDYLRYLSVLLNGSQTEKAMLSFKILSNGKDKILFEDIYHLVLQVSYLWTNMTSTNCIPTQEYVENIFSIFDYDKDGEVSFNDYYNIYSLETEIFAWFEFLNQSEINIQKMRSEYEINMKNKRKGSHIKFEEQVLQQNENNMSLKISVIKNKLSDLSKNLIDSLQMIQAERDNIIKANQEQKEHWNRIQDSPPSSSSHNNHFQSKQIHGPQVLFHSPTEKSGDDHPEEDESQEDLLQQLQQRQQYYHKNEALELNFQNDIVRKLKQVLAISQTIRGVCSQRETKQEEKDSGSPTLKNTSSLLQFPQSSYTNIYPISPGKRKNQRQMTQRAAAEQRVKQAALFKKSSQNYSDLSPVAFLSHDKTKSFEQSPYLQSNQFLYNQKYKTLVTSNKKSEQNKQLQFKFYYKLDHFDSSALRDDGMPFEQQENVRKNLSIYFGHQNWNLVLNMMIGIRQAIVDLYPSEYDKELLDVHYNDQKMYDLYPKKNSGYDVRDTCKFYDYAPKIFERIRSLYGINNEQYRRSIGPEALLGNLIMGNLSNLTEKCSSGKSGSFFYYSYDDQYMLKTISKEEFFFFRKIIKPYFTHLNRNRDTLIIKIYGLHHMEVYQSKNKFKEIYFCVMGNLFRWNREIDYRYDLKGSTYGRSSRSNKHQTIDKSIALKDLDWLEDKKYINVSIDYQIYLKNQIEADTKFFVENEIIDYSLLVGYSDITDQDKEEDQSQSGFQQQNQEYLRAYEKYKGGIPSLDGTQILYIGIIDIFTEYRNLKKIEYFFKTNFVSKTISCVPPIKYGDRFKDFMLKFIVSQPPSTKSKYSQL